MGSLGHFCGFKFYILRFCGFKTCHFRIEKPKPDKLALGIYIHHRYSVKLPETPWNSVSPQQKEARTYAF
jgi:hypothetical protein